MQRITGTFLAKVSLINLLYNKSVTINRSPIALEFTALNLASERKDLNVRNIKSFNFIMKKSYGDLIVENNNNSLIKNES